MSSEISQQLLLWYDTHQRDLPWRAKPGQTPNSYHVWLSEIMLQQTTVPTVIPYFLSFTKRWPTVQALAQAPIDDILFHWQGLGYYNRAHNLHKCANVIAADYDGILPSSYEKLLHLPGIGPYTAAAIASIAFNQPYPVIDGNVERLMARLFDLHMPKSQLKKPVTQHLSQDFNLAHRPGDLAQGMMDFAGQICLPAKPKCPSCPLQKYCQGYKAGTASQLPIKITKEKPTRYGYFFWLDLPDNHLVLYKRPIKGLLPGLMCLPTSTWQPNSWPDLNKEASTLNISLANSEILPTLVNHTFTHFHFEAQVIKIPTQANILKHLNLNESQIVPVSSLFDHALPTLMKKVIKAANIG